MRRCIVTLPSRCCDKQWPWVTMHFVSTSTSVAGKKEHFSHSNINAGTHSSMHVTLKVWQDKIVIHIKVWEFFLPACTLHIQSYTVQYKILAGQSFGSFTRSKNLADYILLVYALPYWIHFVYLTNIWLRIFFGKFFLPKFCIIWG